jgi:hypothetical protein
MSAKKKHEQVHRLWETYNPNTGEYREGSTGGSGCLAMMLTFGLYRIVAANVRPAIERQRGES